MPVRGPDPYYTNSVSIILRDFCNAPNCYKTM